MAIIEEENELPEVNFNIRLARDEDFAEIFSIWLEGISMSFDTTQINIEELREKLSKVFFLRNGIFNYWVFVMADNKIAGWQSLNKCTMNPLKDELFAESSTYVKSEYRQHKIGDHLLTYVIEQAKSSSLHYVTAYVSRENTAIRRITNHLGFIEVGDVPHSDKKKQIDKIYIIRPL